MGSIPILGNIFLLLCYFVFTVIVLVFIDTDTCPQVFYKSFCRIYINWTRIFSFHAGLRKVMARVTVGRSYLSISHKPVLIYKGG